jgi:hypothetical protein
MVQPTQGRNHIQDPGVCLPRRPSEAVLPHGVRVLVSGHPATRRSGISAVVVVLAGEKGRGAGARRRSSRGQPPLP